MDKTTLGGRESFLAFYSSQNQAVTMHSILTTAWFLVVSLSIGASQDGPNLNEFGCDSYSISEEHLGNQLNWEKKVRIIRTKRRTSYYNNATSTFNPIIKLWFDIEKNPGQKDTPKYLFTRKAFVKIRNNFVVTTVSL